MSPALLALLSASSPAAEAASEPVRHRDYVLIVASNASREAGVKPLQFADDDAAKYHELFTATGARVSLFAVLDPDVQAAFPAATAAARPPLRDAVLAAVDGIFAEIQAEERDGAETTFTFVYAGHGGMGPNREGYITLQDGTFGRTELYRRLLSRSPADWNHLLIDACHAYFFVEKRGEAATDRTGDYTEALRQFMLAEELSSYPNTGVILAASSESETHEWNRWRAGVFSHELRSALLGPGDVNGDGLLTYGETAAAVEAANVTITDPRARLRIYARPPRARVELPLLDLRRIKAPRLRFAGARPAHYYVEDARGVRLADLHPGDFEEPAVALVGKPPFFVRTATEEAELEGVATVALADLQFTTRQAQARGSIQRAFSNHLYEAPFSTGFYLGMRAARDPASLAWMSGPGGAPSVTTKDTSPYRFGMWGSAGVFVASMVATVALGVAANDAHQDYGVATSAADAARLRGRTETLTGWSIGMGVVAGAAAVSTAVLFLLDWLEPSTGSDPYDYGKTPRTGPTD